MTIRGQRYSSAFLTTAIMLSLLSLIIICLMALFQLTLGVESQNTYWVLFIFTFVPATALSWSSLIGRLMNFVEYPDRKDATLKSFMTLALAMVLSAFTLFLIMTMN